jgi:hypothetical protein
MGDRSAVEIRVYGVAGHEQEIVDIFCDGWGLDWGSIGNFAASDVTEGVRFCDDERSIGTLYEDDVLPALEALGISYEGLQSGKYEFAAVERMFAPDLGIFVEEALGDDGGPGIAAHRLDEIVDRAEAISGAGMRADESERALYDLFFEIDKMTGRAHRNRFTELRKAIPSEIL